MGEGLTVQVKKGTSMIYKKILWVIYDQCSLSSLKNYKIPHEEQGINLPKYTYFKIHDPAAYHDTDTQRYRCSLVKRQINYNKEKNKHPKYWST